MWDSKCKKNTVAAITKQALPTEVAKEALEKINQLNIVGIKMLEQNLESKFRGEAEEDAEWRDNADMRSVGVKDQINVKKSDIEQLRAVVNDLKTCWQMPNPSDPDIRGSPGHPRSILLQLLKRNLTTRPTKHPAWPKQLFNP